MVSQFCILAKEYYCERQDEIEILNKKYRNTKIDNDELFKDYTKEGFFYKLLNRLLRGGRDPF